MSFAPNSLNEVANVKHIVIFLFFMNVIFRYAYLIRSYPKGCCIDLVLKFYVVFMYLNLPRLGMDRFEIFASVFINISVQS